MECNKDEAVRAKQIAEKKMESNDFNGALKIAQKAQNLYPELENITQILCICEVHCSSQKKIIGAEKDWYGILQVERLADEPTVRKQYRRLALVLHPDKNRFPGAESAFKLICEANAILSDSTKKIVYDNKIRVSVVGYAPVVPAPHMKQNYQFKEQYGAPRNVPNGFSVPIPHQPAQPSSSVRQEMFWTSCDFCSMKYQFPRNLMLTSLKCRHCSKSFVGRDISWANNGVPATARTVPVNFGVSQTSGVQGKSARSSNNGVFGTARGAPVKIGVSQPFGVQGTSTGSSVSREAAEWCASRKAVRSEPGTREVGAKDKGVDIRNVNPSHGQTEGNGEKKKKEKGNLKNKRRKKGRKNVVLSSESSDIETSSDSDMEDVAVNKDFNSDPTQVRRSSRARQNVTYNEGAFLDEDDDPNGTAHPEENKDGDVDEKVKVGVKADGVSGDHSDHIMIESDSDQDSNIKENPVKEISCEDPEFNDFEKDREESCFSARQLWAIYDEADSMPRYYAKVKKVSTSPFELNIIWLEAKHTNEAQKKWIKAELPVSCGTYKHGKNQKMSSRFTFSHQLHCVKGKGNSFTIYPRKGQVWAIYRDWDLNWTLNPDDHSEYKYEIVEIISDFDEVVGADVCYMDKVEGFVSLFQRSSTSFFLIGPKELYKFSHSIPSYKMTGSEREGVPKGSLELDPASLPLNPDALYYPGKTKMNTGAN